MSRGNEKETPFKHLLSIPACWGGHQSREGKDGGSGSGVWSARRDMASKDKKLATAAGREGSKSEGAGKLVFNQLTLASGLGCLRR